MNFEKIEPPKTKLAKKTNTVAEAMADIRSAGKGRCQGCGSPADWDHTIAGTSGQNNDPCVWACCAMHDTITIGGPVSATTYIIVSRAAQKEKMSVQELVESDYCR